MRINIKAKISQMGLDPKKLSDDIMKDLRQALEQLSRLTYNKLVEIASQKLHSTRDQYINALKMGKEGDDVWVVVLMPEANHLEEGYGPFDMKYGLTHGPKSKVAKDGHRYAVIPLRHTTEAANPNNAKQLDLASRLKQVVQERKFKKIREGVSEKTGRYTTVEKLTDNDVHPYLRGMVRVREYAEKGATKPLSSAYFTFRVASEKQSSSAWRHPGYAGISAFPEASRWAESQVEVILREFFS